MRTLLIVFHSATGGTRQMAEAAARGAGGEDGVTVRLMHAGAAAPEDVLAAQAYVFATPENLGSMAGLMKDFFDRCYYPAFDKVNGRAYASMVCAGSDGQGAARQIERIATGLGWELLAVDLPSRLRAALRPDHPCKSATITTFAQWRQAEPAYVGSVTMFDFWLRKRGG